MPKRRPPAPSAQLELFAPTLEAVPRAPSHTPAEQADSALRERFVRLQELGSRVPAHVRFGTSSWSFPGWSGIVYPPGWDESRLARDGLPLYVRHPLFRTVGIDRSYYAPLSEAQLRKYASQLPAGFPCCAKVPETFTRPVLWGRGDETAGEPNADFLDPHRFREMVLRPFHAAFRDNLGALILEFPPVPPEHRLPAAVFLERLDRFLRDVGKEAPLAVEVRDRALLTSDYASLLRSRGASHVYNYWTAMPELADQQRVVPMGAAPLAVVRLMLRPGTRYAARKRELHPFDKIADPNPLMRAQVADLASIAASLGTVLFVLVNNKAEGSAPLTIEALAEACAAPRRAAAGIQAPGLRDATGEEPT